MGLRRGERLQEGGDVGGHEHAAGLLAAAPLDASGQSPSLNMPRQGLAVHGQQPGELRQADGGLDGEMGLEGLRKQREAGRGVHGRSTAA